MIQILGSLHHHLLRQAERRQLAPNWLAEILLMTVTGGWPGGMGKANVICWLHWCISILIISS